MEDFAKQEKLKQFINNPVLSEAVRLQLLGSFLKKKGNEDVNTKAARFIATELLQEAWQELETYRLDNSSAEKSSKFGHV